MKITLNLENPYVLIEDKRITLPQEVVIGAAPKAKGLKLFVRTTKGEKAYSLDKDADITELLTAGKVELSVAQYDGTELVARWQVEPLVCKRATNETYLMPEIEAMKADLENLTKAVIELHKLVKGE